jgi:hypothetical protein
MTGDVSNRAPMCLWLGGEPVPADRTRPLRDR